MAPDFYKCRHTPFFCEARTWPDMQWLPAMDGSVAKAGMYQTVATNKKELDSAWVPVEHGADSGYIPFTTPG